jgi:hypothetical protein
MKNYFLLTALMLMSGLIFAQNESSDVDLAEHKIVFQLTSGDTNVHKMLVRQLGNVLTARQIQKLKWFVMARYNHAHHQSDHRPSQSH